jgi:hypothetical protein
MDSTKPATKECWPVSLIGIQPDRAVPSSFEGFPKEDYFSKFEAKHSPTILRCQLELAAHRRRKVVEAFGYRVGLVRHTRRSVILALRI